MKMNGNQLSTTLGISISEANRRGPEAIKDVLKENRLYRRKDAG